LNVIGSFKKEWREQGCKDELFGKNDVRCEWQERENNTRGDKAHTVRKTKAPGQHGHDSGNQQ
jgi:hypothetical protein